VHVLGWACPLLWSVGFSPVGRVQSTTPTGPGHDLHRSSTTTQVNGSATVGTVPAPPASGIQASRRRG